MRTCEYDGVPFTEPRSHPWTDARASEDYRYYDLKTDPSRIRTSLEDFVAWSHYPAIDAFYTLIEWLNGNESTLESNDCAFTGPHANDIPAFAQPLQCSGRIMVLHRALAENVARQPTESLKERLHHHLGALDPDLAWGMIGTTIVPVRYLALPGNAQLGTQLMISFWAWGSSEKELMGNLARVVRNLSVALYGEAIGTSRTIAL